MAADGPELPQRGAVPATGAIPELQAQLGQGKGRPMRRNVFKRLC